MDTSSKIVTKEEFKKNIRPVLKKDNKTIALCHGVFDLVHPGHVSHFRQAKAMADVLVVSVTAKKYVRKGPGRPYFDDETRLNFLSSIEYIDYVILSEGYTVDDIIEVVEPDLYVKGAEYQNAKEDVTGGISHEREIVESHGGKLAFTGGQVFSSTKLINNALNGMSAELRTYMQSFDTRHSFDEVKDVIGKAKDKKILVLGDTIIDRYTYCRVQGLMSKDMAYSARKHGSEDFLGGAVAIARHLSTFSDSVTLLSVIGSEPEIISRMNSGLSDKMSLDLIQSEDMETIIKERFVMVNKKRDEYDKIFTINNISEIPSIGDDAKTRLLQKLQKTISNYDIVFLADFGHGMIDKDIIDFIQENAKYLVLNCQTNSSNRGLNIITKYKKTDVFSLDQTELSLAEPGYETNDEEKLLLLSKKLSGRAFLTRGSSGAYALDKGKSFSCPALTLSVRDTIGAGDAFYSVAGLSSYCGADAELALFLGNAAGALGANILGNKESVEKVNLLKFASTLMNV